MRFSTDLRSIRCRYQVLALKPIQRTATKNMTMKASIQIMLGVIYLYLWLGVARYSFFSVKALDHFREPRTRS